MLMQIDGTLVFAIISFLIFLFIMKTILYQPITKVIKERDNFYLKNSKMETTSKEKSKALLDEKENLLTQSRIEATTLLKESNEKNKTKSDEILKEAKKVALEKIEENQKALFEEQNKAKKEIKSEVNNIVNSIISKVLNEKTEISLEDDEINRYLKI